MAAKYSDSKTETLRYIYGPMVQQAINAEHAGDHARRAELLADLNLLRREWMRRGFSALDGASGWPRWTPATFEAERKRLAAIADRITRSGDRGEKERAAKDALAAHVAEGEELGYL